VAEAIVNVAKLLVLFGPVQLKIGFGKVVVAFKIIGFPTHTEILFAVTVGAVGAPGLIML
jgi:hypothetical protein